MFYISVLFLNQGSSDYNAFASNLMVEDEIYKIIYFLTVIGCLGLRHQRQQFTNT